MVDDFRSTMVMNLPGFQRSKICHEACCNSVQLRQVAILGGKRAGGLLFETTHKGQQSLAICYALTHHEKVHGDADGLPAPLQLT